MGDPAGDADPDFLDGDLEPDFDLDRDLGLEVGDPDPERAPDETDLDLDFLDLDDLPDLLLPTDLADSLSLS